MTTKQMEQMIGQVVIEKQTGEEYKILDIYDCWHGVGKVEKKR